MKILNKVGKVKIRKWDDLVINKIRKNLRSSVDDVEKIFKKVDKSGQKVLTLL